MPEAVFRYVFPLRLRGNTYLNTASGISSLSASTTYHFRVVASNSSGTSMGSDSSFTTLAATGAPVVTTGSATNVTSSSATLNGSLDPHGLLTTVSFQWGTTTSYGHTTAMQSQTGNTYRNIAANISSLTTHTTYHFRIVATNSSGTTYGSDRTFTTTSCNAIQNGGFETSFFPPWNSAGTRMGSDRTFTTP